MEDYTAPQVERSALLTIDVQKDFSDAGATAEILGTSDCVPMMQRVVEAYRSCRLPIVHVVRHYLPDGANADICRKTVIERGAAIVAPGSAGAELVEALKPEPQARLDARKLLAGDLQRLADNEWAIYKPRWDAFYNTPLEQHLRNLAVTTVVVLGCNFPNCPRATLYGASMRDFRAVMIIDAVSGVYAKGIRELNAIGVTTPSAAAHLADLASTFGIRAIMHRDRYS